MSVDTHDSGAPAATVTVPQRTVAAVQKFVAEHGGSATAVIQPVGYAGVRITLVGADGILGDQVVEDVATANAVVAAVAGVTVSEWERELVSVVTPRVGHWRKMAGWVANQTRFPKARNGL
ncbi:hypothetical protein [Rhodococcus tukisamuensis]|uniref:Uncharacterized protein n=1 Tax=Rhodococcus tukisamuensis TaxID=168276 RepID=A0A1G7EIC8_9NOCA|nr:hypothetical protein [Rhodococcus tukisamuensis]SDE63176.1 hypothetical protein SAMN05444580_12426 [Rhodococcus tukisamuensis]